MTTPPTTLPRFIQIVEAAIRQERENSLDDHAYGADLRAVMAEEAKIMEEGIEWVRRMANRPAGPAAEPYYL